MPDDATQRADLHRMVMEDHMCPFGLKTLDLLRREGYEVADHPLTSRDEVEEFKARNDVETTPQVFIGGNRIGGYEDVRRFLGKDVADKDAVTYVPVIALFAMAAAMALATSWATRQPDDRGCGRMVHCHVHVSAGPAEAQGCGKLCDHVPEL